MALTDILEKIRKEAAERIAQLEKEFDEKKQKLEEENEKKQKLIDEDLHEKIEEKSKKILEKAENLANREAQNLLLEEKRKIIDECMEEAIKKLSEADNYQSTIASILKKTDIEGDNVVVIPAKGREDETKKAIKDSGKNYFLSDKSADFKGGVLIKTAKVELDNSFETIIKSQLKEELEIQIHKTLF